MLLYLATVPFVRRRWTALLPAVVVLFGGSQVFLEHAVLSDAPYTFVLVVALYCALRGMRSDERSLWWLAAAGAALAASATLRTVGAFLLPLLATWILLPREQPWRARLAGAGTMLGTAGLLLIVYLIPQHAETGSWGLTRTAGFTFYARMAPLADCTRFTPPPGTARLCQRSEPSTRANANRYIFSAQAPAVRLYGAPPYPRTPVEQGAYRYGGDEPTRRFAKAVLVHQPLDYLASVAEGLGNFVVPRAGRPSVFEYDQDELVTQLHDPRFEGDAAADITSFYSTRAGYLRRNVDALDSYGRTVKLEGALTAVLALLALAGGISDAPARATPPRCSGPPRSRWRCCRWRSSSTTSATRRRWLRCSPRRPPSARTDAVTSWARGRGGCENRSAAGRHRPCCSRYSAREHSRACPIALARPPRMELRHGAPPTSTPVTRPSRSYFLAAAMPAA